MVPMVLGFVTCEILSISMESAMMVPMVLGFVTGVWLSVGTMTAILVEDGEEPGWTVWPRRVGMVLLGPIPLVRTFLDLGEGLE